MDRFCEVTDKVFRGSCPTPEELKGLKDIFGIKRIISLDGPLADQLASHCKNLDIEQIKLPIEFDNFGPMLQKLKEDIVPMLLDNQPCFIHCRHGKDRTGAAIALYRIQGENWKPGDALKEAEEFDFGSGLQPEVLKFYTDIILNCENDIGDDSNNAYDSDSTVGGLQQQNSFAPMGPQPYIRMAQEDKKQKKKEKLKKLLDDSNDADIQGNVPITGQTDNNGILGGNYVENARQRFPWTIT